MVVTIYTGGGVKMGFFDKAWAAVKETNESAHGARLKRDTFATLELLHAAGPDVETEGLLLYARLQEDIMEKCKSWSRDGRLKMADQFQAEARKHKDFDISRSYGYYLASAFLESMVRESLDAQMTFLHLGTVAEEVRKQLAIQTRVQKILAQS